MPHSPKARLYLAFFLIYFIWGSTYLAIRYAVQTIPPFLMAGLRFFLAGVVMYGFLRLQGAPSPSWGQWWRLAVVGVFLFLGGNGLVVWAEQYIESGLAALLVSTLPLWLLLLDWLWAGGRPPQWMALLGIALGIAGTVLLVGPAQLLSADSLRDPAQAGAAAVVVLASVLWAIGSIYTRKFQQPRSIFMSAACEMTGGGLALLAVSVWQQEWQGFSLQQVSWVSAAGWVYLFVAGSMVAISAYVWLLQNASAASISTYAFVNPVVALGLGWLIADETIDLRILTGAGIILAGVVLVVKSTSASAAASTSPIRQTTE